MNKSFLLGVVGFLIGGSFTAYSELKTNAIHTPATAQAARQPEARQRKTNKNDVPRAKTRPKREARRPKRENEHITHAKARVSAEARVIAKPVQPPRKARHKQADNPGVRSTDPVLAFDVRMNRVLVGEELVTAGILPESTLDEYGKHGKYLVYFDLSFPDPDKQKARSVRSEDFRLEGTEGLIYTPLPPADAGTTDTHRGSPPRCGVAFALYNDSAPARLLYRTGKKTFTPLPESVFWRSR